MSFDILSAIVLTAAAAIATTVLAFTLSRTAAGRLKAVLALALWFAGVVVIGATLALGPGSSVGTPGLAAAVLLPVAVICAGLFGARKMRDAMMAMPLPVLIAFNILRVAGYIFIALWAVHRLPSPFAPVAGWGDILVGVTAGPVAWLAARQGARANPVVFVWNLAGFFDLVSAVSLGALSAAGPIRLFMEPPGSGIMTALPWILVPCFLVPIFESVHIAIFYRLARNATLSLDARTVPAKV